MLRPFGSGLLRQGETVGSRFVYTTSWAPPHEPHPSDRVLLPTMIAW
jgi:hypothetical protein